MAINLSWKIIDKNESTLRYFFTQWRGWSKPAHSVHTIYFEYLFVYIIFQIDMKGATTTKLATALSTALC